MSRRRAIVAHLRAFRQDESGSITIESLIVLPLLAWAFLAAFIFFEGFHRQAVNIKAAYTIGDALSRETGYVTTNYINGLFGLQALLLDTGEQRSMQVAVYSFNPTQNRFEVRWSQGRGGLPALTTTTLAPFRDRLPAMPAGEVAVFTRSRVDYTPLYDVGIDPFAFDEVTVTRPRFAPQLCWNSLENGTAATATC
ncbi:MAG: pilus assembly protein [Rubellimicrobium sp.]|nr:pilus assembly protein [Rubellimicrobium sp.]